MHSGSGRDSPDLGGGRGDRVESGCGLPERYVE